MNYRFTISDRIKIFIQLFIANYIPFGRKFRQRMYSLIGNHYFEKTQSHPETKKVLELIGITYVWFKRGHLYIKCCRPGILIGKRGADIHNLSNYIKNNWNMKIAFRGIHIVENKELGHLYNYQFFAAQDESHWSDFDD